MDGLGLYMLAVMPPEQLSKDIAAVRLAFAERYHCKAALKPPVHITLIPPFKTLPDHIQRILLPLKELAKSQIPFPLTIKNYDNFGGNKVVYLNIVQEDLLKLMQQNLVSKMKHWFPDVVFNSYKSFHPHITIGYRDIPEDLFDAAAFAYKHKEFYASFVVDAIHLWKHNGLHWEVMESFPAGLMGSISGKTA